jgi:hypothetical protein
MTIQLKKNKNQNMSYNLFLDDKRIPITVYNLILKDERYLREEWVIAKNYEEFQGLLLSKGIPRLISFDHDLADEHYLIGMSEEFFGFDYSKCTEKTGMDCAKLLIKMCLDFELKWFPEYIVHSQNPVGKANISSYLRSYKKTMNL